MAQFIISGTVIVASTKSKAHKIYQEMVAK